MLTIPVGFNVVALGDGASGNNSVEPLWCEAEHAPNAMEIPATTMLRERKTLALFTAQVFCG
jgi:hypothetical protein